MSELVTRIDTNSITAKIAAIPTYNKVIGNTIITAIAAVITDLPENHQRELASQIAAIFGRKSTQNTFIGLCRLRAATPQTLVLETGQEETGIIRGLHILNRLKVIEPVCQLHGKGPVSGPRPYIWALVNYKPEDIAHAEQHHLKNTNPLMTISRRIAQILLDEYFTPKGKNEAYLRDVLPIIKRENFGFPSTDLVDNVSIFLKKQDVIIWR